LEGKIADVDATDLLLQLTMPMPIGMADIPNLTVGIIIVRVGVTPAGVRVGKTHPFRKDNLSWEESS
jgi:hypothetical protein